MAKQSTPAHTSSTQDVPEVTGVPKHVAIIMDGNGRWATKRFLPRVAGHKQGLETVRKIVKELAMRDEPKVLLRGIYRDWETT